MNDREFVIFLNKKRKNIKLGIRSKEHRESNEELNLKLSEVAISCGDEDEEKLSKALTKREKNLEFRVLGGYSVKSQSLDKFKWLHIMVMYKGDSALHYCKCIPRSSAII